MRSGKVIAALALLPALLTGCGPKQPKTIVSPVAVQAPSLPPTRMVALLPSTPPPIPATKRPILKLDTTAPPEMKTETASNDHRPPKRRSRSQDQLDVPKPTVQTTAAPATPNPQIASVQPAEKSPIGQLSAENDNANTADRHQISDQIDSTENGLNAIKRSFSTDEQKTVAQIRNFITRARDALKVDDLDGARTLSTKAHLLLLELTQQ